MTSTLVPALASGGLVGFSLGLVGGGGSILATPLLLYVVGVASPHVAIGTGALAVSINAYANLLAHARKGHVRWLCAAVFAVVGTLGALLGSSLGLVVDGTGKVGYRADGLIEGETIVRIGAVDPAAAERIIDCAGLVVALEPWFLRTTDKLITDPDGWTLRSADGSRGAHAEHTIAVTDDGPIILTDRSFLGVR